MTGKGQFLASYNDDFATLQKVFGYNWSKSTDQVATAVDDYCLQIDIEQNEMVSVEVMFYIAQKKRDFFVAHHTNQCEENEILLHFN